MDRDGVLAVCERLTGSVEDYPFGDDVAVFKVLGRMFALVQLSGEQGRVTLTCDPVHAIELRARFAAVTPGYHTNKRHTVSLPPSSTAQRHIPVCRRSSIRHASIADCDQS